MSESTIDQNVEKAAAALIRGEDSNWELAKLTHENTRTGGGHPPANDGLLSISEWSERVRQKSDRKFSKATAMLYRAIWAKFIHYERSELPPWNEAYYEVRGKSREEMDEGFVTAKARTVIEGMEHVKPEVKQELADKVMADPEVEKRQETKFVQKAAKDHVLAGRVNAAYDEHNILNGKQEPSKQDKLFDLFGVGTDIHAAVGAKRRNVEELATHLEQIITGPEEIELTDGVIDSLSQTIALIQKFQNRLLKSTGRDPDAIARRLIESV